MRQLPRTLIFLLALVAVLLGAARADETPFGVTTEWVRDDAHVLSAPEKQRLEDICRSLQEKAGYQLVVLTLPTLNGEDPNHAATRYGNEMRAGRTKADTGVVMLLAMQEHQFYIATGKGTEAVLPDSLAGGISRNVVRPYLKEGKFGQALIAGAIRISETLEGGEDATPWPLEGGGGAEPASPARGTGLLGWMIAFFALFGGIVPLAVVALIIGLIVHATRTAKKCPRCGHVMNVTEHVVKAATRRQAGYGYRERHCPNCGYHDRQRYTIPARGGDYWGGPFIGGGFGGGGWSGGSSGGWGGGGGFGGGGGGFSGGGGSFGGGGGGTSW